MSTRGLIAQAVLGATGRVGQGIGDRIRADAKLKRDQALDQTRTENNKAAASHASDLRRGENEQQHKLTLEQQKAQDKDARGRIRLTSELGTKSYEDVTDEAGNIIGQRETGSNQYMPYTKSGSKNDAAWKRRELAITTLSDEINAIRESAGEMGGAMDEGTKKRLDRMTTMRDQLMLAEPGSTFEQLLIGESGAAGGTDGSAPASESEPSGIKGLLGDAMKGKEQQKQTENVQSQIERLEDEADTVLESLKVKPVSGQGGRPSPDSPRKASPEALAKAQAMVQKLLAIDNDPQMSSALSPRQRAKIVDRIMEFQRAGVPVDVQ